MEGRVEALEEGASPSDAHQTLHKDQLAVQGGRVEVKDKDGWFKWSIDSVPAKGVKSAPSQLFASSPQPQPSATTTTTTSVSMTIKI